MIATLRSFNVMNDIETEIKTQKRHCKYVI